MNDGFDLLSDKQQVCGIKNYRSFEEEDKEVRNKVVFKLS